MAKTLNILPASLVAGESISATASLTDYPASDGWSVKYRFATPTPIEQACTGGTLGAWSIALSPAKTLTIPSGRIRFDAIASKTEGETITQAVVVDSGFISITASPLTVSAWVAVLASVDSAIATWGTSEQRSFTIEGMQVSAKSLDELLKLRAFCTQQISRDTGNKRPRILHARFNLT